MIGCQWFEILLVGKQVKRSISTKIGESIAEQFAVGFSLNSQSKITSYFATLNGALSESINFDSCRNGLDRTDSVCLYAQIVCMLIELNVIPFLAVATGTHVEFNGKLIAKQRNCTTKFI